MRSPAEGWDAAGLRAAVAGLGLLLAVAGLVRVTEPDPAAAAPERATPVETVETVDATSRPAHAAAAPAPRRVPRPVAPFAGGRTLVAYYGTAGTGALGVLGETSPEVAVRRAARAARAFRRPGRPVGVVLELIVSIADRSPGPDRDYSHDLGRAQVAPYVRAARRHGALLLLDVQPGRTPFPQVARRWAWALRLPHVGLALDPEWRMGRRQVPGRVIGSVDGAEVDRTAAWLSAFKRRHAAPPALFVVHQFRREMLRRPGLVRPRRGLVMVQHVDGFGTPAQKLATYHHVARPRQFTLGFKLFYDEDRPLMRPRAVLALRPGVRFVSYQ